MWSRSWTFTPAPTKKYCLRLHNTACLPTFLKCQEHGNAKPGTCAHLWLWSFHMKMTVWAFSKHQFWQEGAK